MRRVCPIRIIAIDLEPFLVIFQKEIELSIFGVMSIILNDNFVEFAFAEVFNNILLYLAE